MGVYVSEAAAKNRKPRSQWKDRFIYAMLGLFAGMIGVHNFYVRRFASAVIQVIMAATWIILLAKANTTAGFIVFALEAIWIDIEVFTVKREKDGDLMQDEARPARILLCALVIVLYQILGTGFVLYQYSSTHKGTTFSLSEMLDGAKLEKQDSN